jgi:hypothetical protein
MNTTGMCASEVISHMFLIPRCLESIRDADRLDVIGTTWTIANLENLIDVAFVGALPPTQGMPLPQLVIWNVVFSYLGCNIINYDYVS